MNCPKCPGEQMKAEVFQGIEIDRCTACQGIFLDPGELKALLLKNLGNEIDSLKYTMYSDDQDEAQGRCPKCDGNAMTPVKAPGDIRLDRCGNCGGLFLDQGEFASLQFQRNCGD